MSGALMIWMACGLTCWLYALFADKIYQDDDGFFGLIGYVVMMLPLSVLLGPLAWAAYALGRI